MKTSGSKCTQGVMEISEDEESKILLLPGNLLIKIPYKNTQSQVRGHSNFNSANLHKETIRKLLKVEENTKQPSSNTTVQLQQSQQQLSQEDAYFRDADNNSNSSCLSRQPTKESLQTNQLIRVAVTQYFKTTKIIEVTYDNENGYKGFDNISRILEELKTMQSLIYSSSSPLTKDLLSQLSEYAELLKLTSFETQTQKCMNNQEFAFSSCVSHAFLEPIAKQIRKQHSKSCGLMFYENLKRVSFGYSCEQRGLSEELCNYIGISKTDLQNGCLLHSYISFLSPQSQQLLISFNIQLRLAAMKKENILKFNKKQFEAEIITNTSSRFSCMIEIEICRVSYKQDFNSDHLLIVYHIFPGYSTTQLNCVVANPSKLEDQSSDNNSPKMSTSNLNMNKNKQQSQNLNSQNFSANTNHYRAYMKQFPC